MKSAVRAAIVWIAALVVASPLWAATEPGENEPHARQGCARILDDAERLRCYDDLAAPSAGEEAGAAGVWGEAQPAGAEDESPEEPPSYLSRLWELDEASREGRFPITPFHSNYILPLTYNATPNQDPIREADPSKEVLDYEVKFQISFKVKLWEDVLSRDVDLWIAYTQLSLWQLYNTEDSSPFRETNYQPEILVNFRTDYPLLGLRGRFINVGFAHESNGRSEPLSRSWNRVVANLGFERGGFSCILNGWYRIPEDDDEDDNPDIEDYLGYGQLNFQYLWRRHRFGLMGRYNFRFHDSRGALEAEWGFPLFKWVGGYVQYFYGYGESLLDYDALTNRIGVGFILKDW
jgi:phospholipase A1